MTQILIVAEHGNGRLNPSTAKCVSCAPPSARPRSISSCSPPTPRRSQPKRRRSQGVRRVLTLERAENAEPLAAVYAPQIAALARGYTPSARTLDDVRQGPDAARRGAARCRADQRRDGGRVATPLRAPGLCRQCAADGGGEPRSRSSSRTVRMASFQPAAAGGAASIEAASVEVSLPTHTRFVSRTQAKSDRPDLQTARAWSPAVAHWRVPRISNCCTAWPMRSAPRSAPRARRSMPATCRTRCRSDRPARSLRRSCTWRWASPGPSST